MSDTEFSDATPESSPMDGGGADAGGGQSAPDRSPPASHSYERPEPGASPWSRAPTGQFARREAPREAPRESYREAPQQVSPGDRPPQSWSSQYDESWQSLPEHVRQYIHQRETEVAKGFSELGTHAKSAESVRHVIEKHRTTLRGADEAQALDMLFEAHNYLERSPKDAIKWLAAQYRVDLSQFGPEPTPGPAAPEPPAPAPQPAAASQFPDELLTPLRELASRGGVNEAAALHHLLAANHYVENSPEEAIEWLARRHGIDLREYGQPSAEELQREISTLEQRRDRNAQAFQRAQEAKRLASTNLRSAQSVSSRPNGNWEATMRATGRRLMMG